MLDVSSLRCVFALAANAVLDARTVVSCECPKSIKDPNTMLESLLGLGDENYRLTIEIDTLSLHLYFVDVEWLPRSLLVKLAATTMTAMKARTRKKILITLLMINFMMKESSVN